MFSTRHTTGSHNMCAVSYQWSKSETTEVSSHQFSSSFLLMPGSKLNGGKDRAHVSSNIRKEMVVYSNSLVQSAKLSIARKEAAVKLITIIKHFYNFTYSKGWPFPSPSITNGCPFTLPSIRSLIFISGLIRLCGTKSRKILGLWICNIELRPFLLCNTHHDGRCKVRCQSYSSCCSWSALFQITRVNETSTLKGAVINLNVTP